MGEVNPEVNNIGNLVVSGGAAAGSRGTRAGCRGRAGQACCFAANGGGGRARGRTPRPLYLLRRDAMTQTVQSQQGRGNIVPLSEEMVDASA